MVRERVVVPKARADQERIEGGEVPRVRTSRRDLEEARGTRYIEALPILREYRASDLADQGLHYRQTIQSGLTAERMEKAKSVFPSSETAERLQEGREFGLNTSSFQLSVLVANFGNLARPSKINDKRIDIKGPSVLAS